jgi:predicted ATPase
LRSLAHSLLEQIDERISGYSAQSGEKVRMHAAHFSSVSNLRTLVSSALPAFHCHAPSFLSSAAAGHLDEALAAADEALQRTERNEALWWMPEALRVKGELVLRSHKPDTANAEELYHRSLALAHRQGALTWELRTATSLARLHREHGHRDNARAALSAVCDRFSEGFDAKDFKTAKALLDSMT